MDSRLLLVLLFATISSTTSKSPYADNFQFVTRPPSLLSFGPYKTINLAKYLNAQELAGLLKELTTKYSDIVKVVQIGSSAVGKEPIWAVEITNNVRMERERLKPMFKFVGNVHGDETVGYALLVSLIQYLVYQYYDNRDMSVKKILGEIDVWIIPTLNPDGLRSSQEGACGGGWGRNNRKGVDIDEELSRPYDPARRYVSTEAYHVVKFLQKHPFVLSGNLQGGAIAASIPPVLTNIVEQYSRSSWPPSMKPSAGRDYTFLSDLATDYARQNPMFRQRCAKQSLTNKKGMADFNFIYTNCLELSLELGCCKSPPATQLPYYWAANLDDLLNLITRTRRGIYGLVSDARGRPVSSAVIQVTGVRKSVSVTRRGEYWRLLSPGWYNVSASARGYKTSAEMKYVDPTVLYARLDFVLVKTSWIGK